MRQEQEISRRPLKSRGTKWAGAIASALARAGVRPNAISVASMGFAGLAGICFWYSGKLSIDWQRSVFLILSACGIQLRLLCNLFDGMVAIEGGFKTPSGELFNELPDRFSDAFILIGAAYALPEFSWMSVLGWSAAVLAVITAYVRALGASMGAGQHFVGPMAKPHRMAVMTGACLASALAPFWAGFLNALPLALGIIALGCLITILRRSQRIVREMKSK